MMASSQDDHHPNRDHQRTSSSSDENTANNNDHNHNHHYHESPPQPNPQETMGYPPVMGYPPPSQYPPPSPGHYPPYNAFGHYPPYPPAVAVPGYYNPHQPPCLSQLPPRFSMSKVANVIITVVIFFIILSCTISVVVYIIFHPEMPEFHLNGLSVTNFSVTANGATTGNFEANITVSNPNGKLKIYFNRIQSYVYYKDPGVYLAWTTEAPFPMETNTSHLMTLDAAAGDGNVGGNDGGEASEEVVADLGRDWRNGTVEMGVEMGMLATFRSRDSWWESRVAMRLDCAGLRVGFSGGNATTGVLAGNRLPLKCHAFT